LNLLHHLAVFNVSGYPFFRLIAPRGNALNKQNIDRNSADLSDAFIRQRVKYALARVEPPADGWKYLLEDVCSRSHLRESRTGFLRTLIELDYEPYPRNLDFWVKASRLQVQIPTAFSLM
jgi:hypothetical protein